MKCTVETKEANSNGNTWHNPLTYCSEVEHYKNKNNIRGCQGCELTKGDSRAVWATSGTLTVAVFTQFYELLILRFEFALKKAPRQEGWVHFTNVASIS